MSEQIKQFWQMSVGELEQALGTTPSAGLSPPEAVARLERYGPNQLEEKKGRHPFLMLLDQFNDFIIWVLVAAALVSGFMQEWVDALAIIGIVILNAILGFIQEHRAEKSLAALRRLSSPASKVIRAGERTVIASAELVPGDLIELEAGDSVPADSRLTSLTAGFKVQEASLTGESTPVEKTARALQEPDVPLSDRANMVYMGTSVVSGKARALVVQTGMATELGKIAGMIQQVEHEPTPLQKKLERFGKWIVYVCLALVTVVFVLGFARGGKMVDVFLTAVSLAVATIPEGLPAVVTIALALGLQRMVKRHALIRKLPSVETLGCATVICSDKTGTLTRNEMTVRAVLAGDRLFDVTGAGYQPKGEFLLDRQAVDPAAHPELNTLLRCGALCNSAQLVESNGGWSILGDPTEGAILTAAAKLGLQKGHLESDAPLVEEIPFDSERKMMTMIRRTDGRLLACVKGAPDVLLMNCDKIESGGAVRPIAEADRTRVLEVNTALANRALRVLGVAYRWLEREPEKYEAEAIESQLTFVGLVAMIDPPRDEVKHAMASCRAAGIRTVMITGDHKGTAVAVGRELGMFDEGAQALTGEELDRLSDEELTEQVERTVVYARVSPEHKLRIVRAWRARGQIVGMTGDGVNDAPAVKEADIGVAMGITGTDVTKEVSDMVVTDDNFASIVAAVEEGRGIYSNIKKFVHYLLSCNFGELLVMFVASLVGTPSPLLPIQILWVNLVTDGLPALALGMDPVEPGIMSRPPRDPKERVVTRAGVLLILAQGAFIALCALTAFFVVLYAEQESIEMARTAAFAVLATSQLFHAFNCRSASQSLFKLGVFSNGKLVLACVASFVLLIAAVSVPGVRSIFKAELLTPLDWSLVVILSSLPLWLMELVKLVAGRRLRGVE